MSRKSRKKRDRRQRPPKWSRILHRPNKKIVVRCPECRHQFRVKVPSQRGQDLISDKQLEAYTWVYVLGETQSLAAERMNTSEAAISKVLKRLREKRPDLDYYKAKGGTSFRTEAFRQAFLEIAKKPIPKRRLSKKS